MKKEKQKPASYRAIARRVIVLVLGIWIVFMGFLTWAVAENMKDQLDDRAWDYLRVTENRVDGGLAELPGLLQISMIRKLGYPYYHLNIEPLAPFVAPQRPSSMSSQDWLWGKWDLAFGYEAASAYYDQDGLLVVSSDYLTFAYTTEDNWLSRQSDAVGYGYIDFGGLEGGEDFVNKYLNDYPTGSVGTGLLLHVLRIRGHFEGAQFYPQSIDAAFAPFGAEHDVSLWNSLDVQTRNITWEPIYQGPSSGQAQQTIYCWALEGLDFDSHRLTINDQSFDSLSDILKQPDAADYQKDSLWECVRVYTRDRSDAYGDYTRAVAVRCWPLQYAANRLQLMYFLSLILVTLAYWLLMRNIKKSLTDPLSQMVLAAHSGKSTEPTAPWKEPYALQVHFADSQQALAEANTQLQQLRTALDYATHAEENRRQLVSNITHELKTPLAVIHSYAEGLQTGIAADKQEQYLSVILSETEKMDAMVLQMLDLSRLEAGKVRLSVAPFSLLQLAQSVTDKFAPLLQEKEICLSYAVADDFSLTADEGRIEQVITNLVSNALKYTPRGGQIFVKVYRYQKFRFSAHFVIENSAPPLSDEALEKVWDSFYRADPARSEPGTGLGLALVKGIVHLHRGTCQVQNTTRTDNGTTESFVRFHVELPL